jgi:hypothetical protein
MLQVKVYYGIRFSKVIIIWAAVAEKLWVRLMPFFQAHAYKLQIKGTPFMGVPFALVSEIKCEMFL